MHISSLNQMASYPFYNVMSYNQQNKIWTSSSDFFTIV